MNRKEERDKEEKHFNMGGFLRLTSNGLLSK
jgi:hypothetical protein